MEPGGGEEQYSYAALCERGKPIASMVARRRRQHPIDFGRSSTFVESIEQPEVEELARRFLKSIAYTGGAEVEFKYDRRSQRYKLLDVNGRFWTWNGLRLLAGVDFPYLAFRQALGETVEPLRARSEVAWMHLKPDVVAACQEIRAGRLTLRGYLKTLRQPIISASFAADDPTPALVELPVAAWNHFVGRIGIWRRRIAQKSVGWFLAGRIAK